jgi:hypothetical protein
MNNFAYIPPDVLRYITGFDSDTSRCIAQIRSVCKQWELALSDNSLILNDGLEAVAIKNHRIILGMFGLRTRLLKLHRFFQDDTVNTFAHKIPNLKELTIYDSCQDINK